MGRPVGLGLGAGGEGAYTPRPVTVLFDDLGLAWRLWRAWHDLQEGTMTAETISQLATLLIPLLVPLLVRWVRAAVPALPKPIVPILAPVLGAVLAGLGDATGATAIGAAGGAGLGLAAIGVREVVDQGVKAARG